MPPPLDSFGCREALPGWPGISFFSLPAAERAGLGPVGRLPYALRHLIENMLRREDGVLVTAQAMAAAVRGDPDALLVFHPERILMQDSSGVPVLADVVAVLEALNGSAASSLAPTIRADLVVDHAVEVDAWGTSDAEHRNLEAEFVRHASRYRFLRWAEERFPWLRVAPPGSGICHQLNLEQFATIVEVRDGVASCDSLLGTDSHTPMINALAVPGWGVGGIEATAALLGQPIVLRVPKVTGVRLHGKLQNGVTAADAALNLTVTLRRQGVVGHIVEFCGEGLSSLTLPDRATLANMAPEYGATMGFFPADAVTLDYMAQTGRDAGALALTRAFLEAQDLLRDADSPEPVFDVVIDFDLSALRPSVAGPSRPDQVRPLCALGADPAEGPRDASELRDGDIVIAAITSCTNTSNPRMLVAAGLLARVAAARGLRPSAWVKTSFAPGSRAASSLLRSTGLQQHLDTLGFQVVGHGCTTCMGNSGPLPPAVETAIRSRQLSVAAVLSGNRNFTGRIHPLCQEAWLMSPPMVVALALAGSVRLDPTSAPLGLDQQGLPVFLADLWPSETEIDAVLEAAALSTGADDHPNPGASTWKALAPPRGEAYAWEGRSGFIRRPPFLEEEVRQPLLEKDLLGARALLLLGDAVTTDHISPVSAITAGSAAADWLVEQGQAPDEWASFSARRLNHEVMLRGGFANPRLENILAAPVEGGVTRRVKNGPLMPVHQAAEQYRRDGAPLIVVAGQRYGAGSARDWAAKVTRLLGVAAVLAEDFERIHRTNLVAMGVLPIRVPAGFRTRLDGFEQFDLLGLPEALAPGGEVRLVVRPADAPSFELRLQCQIETALEAAWLRAGGVLPYIIARAGSRPTLEHKATST
jgi:aconitate hydratase